MLVITAFTITTAVDGPYLKARFGNGRQEEVLQQLNIFFGAAFLVEGILKILVLGIRLYCSSPLNCFDMCTNLLFITEMILGAFGIRSSVIVSLKTFRMVCMPAQSPHTSPHQSHPISACDLAVARLQACIDDPAVPLANPKDGRIGQVGLVDAPCSPHPRLLLGHHDDAPFRRRV